MFSERVSLKMVVAVPVVPRVHNLAYIALPSACLLIKHALQHPPQSVATVLGTVCRNKEKEQLKAVMRSQLLIPVSNELSHTWVVALLTPP